MKTVTSVLAVLMVLIGCIWILQGINILPGSFMTGQIKWAVFGAIMICAGIGVWMAARR